MDMLQTLWDSHRSTILVVGYLILSAVVNALLRKKSPEEWVAYAEQNPRTASIIRFLSATGIDLAKAILALQRALNYRAGNPTSTSTDAKTTNTKPEEKQP